MSDNRPIVPCCTLLLVITDRHTLSTLVVPHQPLNNRQLAVSKTLHRLTDLPNCPILQFETIYAIEENVSISVIDVVDGGTVYLVVLKQTLTNGWLYPINPIKTDRRVYCVH